VLEKRNKAFDALGRALYGATWKSKFARMSGLSQSYISMLSKGTRPVTREVDDAIQVGLNAEVAALRQRIELVRKLLKNYRSGNKA
jgi:hypothetical protein